MSHVCSKADQIMVAEIQTVMQVRALFLPCYMLLTNIKHCSQVFQTNAASPKSLEWDWSFDNMFICKSYSNDIAILSAQQQCGVMCVVGDGMWEGKAELSHILIKASDNMTKCRVFRQVPHLLKCVTGPSWIRVLQCESAQVSQTDNPAHLVTAHLIRSLEGSRPSLLLCIIRISISTSSCSSSSASASTCTASSVSSRPGTGACAMEQHRTMLGQLCTT